MSFVHKTALFVFSFFLAFASLSGTAHIAHAQNTALRISTTPQFPGPHEDVTISVEDFSRDLNRTEITWSVNGTVIKKGTGVKRVQIKTGDIGSVSTVSINMGGNVQSISIRPASIDLLWQADTYTAPFYKGKALHSNQDPLIIVAEPFFLNSQGVRINPDTLIYKWKVGDKVQDAASGYGKRTYRHNSSILMKPVSITVEVSSIDSLYKSSATLTIPDTEPEVLLYENHPLYGVLFDTALNAKTVALEEAEMSIIGLPYFFSREQLRSGDFTYDWSLNSNAVQKNTNELVFRKPETGSGQSSVSLTMKNLERYMQTGEGRLDITFVADKVNNNENIF